ncbi:cellulose synthase-like protein H1 isoform X1 [Senna tora]|uniref:Cellulose synthase-like protein H1 isoform X1 n=1 Tax=Senna tora TaxID=362788 RepID=A0A834SN95_9FABA|nr:cellulose synthase-like protein H1 isoform X1 [Senna tora]
MGSKEEEYGLPLYEKCWIKPSVQKKAMDILILLLLVWVVSHRITCIFSSNSSFPCFLALVCESWFTLTWLITITTRWTPATIKTYPHRLFPEPELPAVDMFVTTADPLAEPPILTVNTVLSLLALDYPTHKLACYVSDDACSPLTFHALVQASNFAKLWLPFCKNHNITVRSPFRYFSSHHHTTTSQSPRFKQDWHTLKDEYDHLCRRIEDGPDLQDQEFADFSNTETRNHPPIVKVIWENSEEGRDGTPHLIYISRDKRPKHPHHYKAGAMNVLARVSGLMTNAPFTLNVDCDMFVNNPQIVQHAMCVLLDSKGQNEVAFVQCPQEFFDGLKDDPFGNQLVVLFTYMGAGLAGLQGPLYGGTNCFHRRKVLYGLSPHDIQNGNIPDETMVKRFGGSKELVKSAASALEGKTYSPCHNVSNSLEAAIQVASCEYEYGTAWGGMDIWINNRGCAYWAENPYNGLEIGNVYPRPNCIYGMRAKRECVGYLWIICWGLRSLPEICYALLPVYCIITNSTFFPKGAGIWMHIALFVVYNINTMSEYILTGLSMRAWWNNQRMTRIMAMNAWFFAVLSIILKVLGISDTVFDITEKDQFWNCGDDEEASRFTFDHSPMFIPGTTILLLQLTAMAKKLMNEAESGGVGELVCVCYLVVCYWPFLKGLFLRAKYGIPLSTLCKSAALAFLFVHFCTHNNHQY